MPLSDSQLKAITAFSVQEETGKVELVEKIQEEEKPEVYFQIIMLDNRKKNVTHDFLNQKKKNFCFSGNL